MRPDFDAGRPRSLMELSILFVMAVMVLRGFFLEGFLISTGSMAPGLLGLHKRVTCPSCGYCFAFGVSFDESVSSEDSSSKLSQRYASCPNCGQAHIEVGSVPSNHGDQLLVHKGVFDLRRPRRWETVVFRNPASPGEAYLKRVVGLPEEALQVIDGDVFIEGEIATKDYAAQRDMRILVHDQQLPATAEDWQQPWHCTGRWQLKNGRFECPAEIEAVAENVSKAQPAERAAGGATDDATAADWLHFHHWRWTGGNHFCETPLSTEEGLTDWLQCLEHLQHQPVSWMTLLQYDQERQVLRLKGVMPYQMQQQLLAWSTSEAFRKAIYRLGALSHLSPVTDRYGYNSLVSSPEVPVRDLMLVADLQWTAIPDSVLVRMPLEGDIFVVNLDFQRQTAKLTLEGQEQPLRVADWRVSQTSNRRGITVEVSNFDHSLLVAVDGQVLFPSLDLAYCADDAIAARITDGSFTFAAGAKNAARTAEFVARQNRLAVGVQGGAVRLENLRLYRDVHYTPGRRTNGVDRPYRIPQGCYFVQGDNSPVSSDSRNWPDPCVPHKLLVGKPFVVHLPSKPAKVTFGGYELPIRIPDFGRIRYIH